MILENDRLRFKDLTDEEKAANAFCILNVGEIKVVYHSLENKHQIVVQFANSDTHLIIDHTKRKESYHMKTKEASIILAPFRSLDQYCFGEKTIATFEDAKVTEEEYGSNVKIHRESDLRSIVLQHIKDFLIHILSNERLVLNKFLHASEIDDSEGKDVIDNYFDIDIEEDTDNNFLI